MDDLHREAHGGRATEYLRHGHPTLFGLHPPQVIRLGTALLAIGLVLILVGILLWVTFTPPDISRSGVPAYEAATNFMCALTTMLSFAGLLLMAVGAYALRSGRPWPTAPPASPEGPWTAGWNPDTFYETAPNQASPRDWSVPGRETPGTMATDLRLTCRRCGSANPEGAVYCCQCGAPL